MEKFSLIVKGTMLEACDSASRIGIDSHSIRMAESRECNQSVMVVYSTYEKISAWFNASNYTDSVPGFGYPIGSLLYYSKLG